MTIESQWTILKSFELSGKSLPQVLNMQSPHLQSFGVIKYHFLSFVLLIVACQKIAYGRKMSPTCAHVALKAGNQFECCVGYVNSAL